MPSALGSLGICKKGKRALVWLSLTKGRPQGHGPACFPSELRRASTCLQDPAAISPFHYLQPRQNWEWAVFCKASAVSLPSIVSLISCRYQCKSFCALLLGSLHIYISHVERCKQCSNPAALEEQSEAADTLDALFIIRISVLSLKWLTPGLAGQWANNQILFTKARREAGWLVSFCHCHRVAWRTCQICDVFQRPLRRKHSFYCYHRREIREVFFFSDCLLWQMFFLFLCCSFSLLVSAFQKRKNFPLFKKKKKKKRRIKPSVLWLVKCLTGLIKAHPPWEGGCV